MRLDLLTDLMDELSRETWFNLASARDLEMRMGEVTITEVNLLAIERLNERSRLNIKLIPTRPDENRTGVDFEIWLRNRRGRILGFSIQAKVVYVREWSYQYKELGHRNRHGLQYDLLEQHARRKKSYPFHLF